MAEPALVGAPPPALRRDRMVQAWIAASVLSWLGTAAWTAALAWQAVHSVSPAWAGVVVAISTIPQALLSLPGGVIADRYSTRTIMMLGQLCDAGVLLAGAALWGRIPALPLLVGAGIAFGVVRGLTTPATATLARQLVRADDLTTVAGWNQVGSRLARLAGAPLGAMLVARMGLPVVMLVDASSFGLTVLALGFLVRPRYRLHGDQSEHWWASLRAGFGYLRRDRVALLFVAGLCGLNVFASPVEGLGLPLRVSASGWPSGVFGMTEAVFSATAIAGSLLAAWISPRRPIAASYWLLIAQGAFYAGVAVPSIPVLTVSMGVMGLTSGCASVWLSAQFVQVVDPAYLGRVAALSNIGDLLLVPLASPAFGALTAAVGIGISPIVPAVAMIAMCALILLGHSALRAEHTYGV